MEENSFKIGNLKIDENPNKNSGVIGGEKVLDGVGVKVKEEVGKKLDEGGSGFKLNVDSGSAVDAPKGLEASGGLVDAIEKQELAKQNLKSILGDTEKLKESLEVEKEFREKANFKKAKIGLVAAVLVMLGIQGFAGYELSPHLEVGGAILFEFKGNLYNSVLDLNKNLISAQTNLNKYRVLSAQLYLNEFSLYSGKYFDGLKKVKEPETPNDRNLILNEINEAKLRLPEYLGEVKKLLIPPLRTEVREIGVQIPKTPEDLTLMFVNEVKQALQEDRRKLLASQSNEGRSEATIDEVKLIENAIKLAGNNSLISELNKTSVEKLSLDLDAAQNAENGAELLALQKLVGAVLSTTKVDLATVGGIKSRRIEWDKLIERIEVTVAQAVIKHNTGTFNNAKIELNSLNISEQSNEFTLNGISTTSSGTNLTLIAFLIDEMEISPYFKEVENRSFSKNVSENVGGTNVFTTSFTLKFKLENQ